MPIFFVIFRLRLSKLLCLSRKNDTGSYEILHLSRKIISANLKIWCSKVQPLSGNQRPDLLTSLMNMCLVLRLPRKMHLYRSSSNVPCLSLFLEMLQSPHILLTFDKMHNPLRLPRETASECPKVVRISDVFNILILKCASRHNGVRFFNVLTSKSGPAVGVLYILIWKWVSRQKAVHFFDISISKSAPNVRFLFFNLQMHFAPQRRALFRHLTFQKWSGTGVLYIFWFGNVLRATTAYTFSTSQFLKVLRSWGVLCIVTWTCTSRHNGMQFFISRLASWLRTRHFSEPIFRSSGAINHWKNISRFSYLFTHVDLLSSEIFPFFDILSSSLLFFSLTLPISDFHLSILSEI